MTIADLPPLTAVQRAVLQVVVDKGSDWSTTPDDWFRAGLPFRGERAAFASHLRKLTKAGWIHRHEWEPLGLSERKEIGYRPSLYAVQALIPELAQRSQRGGGAS